MRFRLIGVINRLDRRDFNAAKGEGGCGEVRFIYRLAYSFDYKERTLASRMPFNFNAVFTAAPDADGECTGVAGRWTPQLDETVDAGWLIGGRARQGATHLQAAGAEHAGDALSVGQEPGFGGQAAYLMRIFGIDGDKIVEKPLENTPDVARIAEDDALKAKLAAYVRDNVAAIDTGVYQMPDEFLAKKVISFTTFGSARLATILSCSCFKAGDFADLDYRAAATAALAGSSARTAGQQHLPGLPPDRLDRGLPFHRSGRSLDVAAQPDRGRHLAAFPCRAAAPRRLS